MGQPMVFRICFVVVLFWFSGSKNSAELHEIRFGLSGFDNVDVKLTYGDTILYEGHAIVEDWSTEVNDIFVADIRLGDTITLLVDGEQKGELTLKNPDTKFVYVYPYPPDYFKETKFPYGLYD